MCFVKFYDLYFPLNNDWKGLNNLISNASRNEKVATLLIYHDVHASFVSMFSLFLLPKTKIPNATPPPQVLFDRP